MKPEFWMKWDLDSLEGTKMKYFLLGFENKDAALGTFLRLVTILYQRDEPWITVDDVFVETYCHESGCSEQHLEQVVDRLCAAGLFCLKQNEANEANHSKTFSSNRVLEEIKCRNERLAVLSSKRAEAGRKGGINSRGSKQNEANDSKTKQTKPDKSRLDKKRVSNTINSPNGSEVKKDPEPEPQKRGGSLKLSELNWPPCLNNQQCKEALTAWLAHKKQRRESYKNADSVNRLLKHWGKTSAATFLDVVDTAIRNNWAGLHPPDPRRKPDGSRKTNDDLNRELHERIAAEEAAALQAEADAARAHEAEQAAMEAEHGN